MAKKFIVTSIAGGMVQAFGPFTAPEAHTFCANSAAATGSAFQITTLCDPVTLRDQEIFTADLIAASPAFLAALKQIAIANTFDIERGEVCALEMRQIARNALAVMEGL